MLFAHFRIFYFHLFFIIAGIANAQSGPGGVGSSANNAMWLSADFGTFINAGTTAATHGQQVQQWNDRSGNNRHATQATAANRPTLRTNNINGYPGLRFTGDLFIDGPSPGIANTSSYTYLLVFRDTTTGLGGTTDGNGHFILDRTSATNDLVSLKPVTGNFYFYQKRNAAGAGLGGVTGTSSINTNIKSIILRRNYNVNYQLFYNNTQEGGTLADADGATLPPPPRIGRHTNTTNGGIRGYIYEFIIYSMALNSAQITIINNYLSAKFGFSLSSLDLYTMDTPANGNYDHEVAGIGRVDASNIHNDAKGSGIVRMLNPGGLNNNEFLFWGHDNGSLNANQVTDVPAGVQARINRVWRVSEVTNTGAAADIGTLDMQWDLSGLGTVTAADLRLLVDTDNDGLFADETPISGATSLGANIYQFAGVSAIQNTRRFTLGTANTAQTPLPIELIGFTAVPKNENSVELNWHTAAEVNNDFFTVERSSDAMFWEEVLRQKARGSWSRGERYSGTDDRPLPGISYYRLKQTDFDLEYSYSPIVFVDRKQEDSKKSVVYPNPGSSSVRLVGSAIDLSEISISNSVGQDVTALTTITPHAGSGFSIDISKLAAGIYFIKTKSSAEILLKNQ